MCYDDFSNFAAIAQIVTKVTKAKGTKIKGRVPTGVNQSVESTAIDGKGNEVGHDLGPGHASEECRGRGQTDLGLDQSHLEGRGPTTDTGQGHDLVMDITGKVDLGILAGQDHGLQDRGQNRGQDRGQGHGLDQGPGRQGHRPAPLQGSSNHRESFNI